MSDVWSRRDTFLPSLTAQEREIFERLQVEKRKRDWLAGRVAAKRAVQRLLGLPFPKIEIGIEPSGRPTVAGAHISITHSEDVAAAVAAKVPIGLDVEVVEPRDESFEALVLTGTDRRRLQSSADRTRELTVIWCEKEAYSKREGEGLRIPFQELQLPPDLKIERGDFEMGGQRFVWVTVV